MTESRFKNLNRNYQNNGFVDLGKIPDQSISLFDELTLADSTSKYYETDNKSIRSYYIDPTEPDLIAWLQSREQIVKMLRSLLGSSFYIYQAKINLKNDIETSVWPHHRDYYFWKYFDGVKKPDMINLVILLDEVNIKSGALTLLQGSNNFFFQREKEFADVEFSIDSSASYDLAFEFNSEEIELLQSNHKMHPLTGKKGTITAFHPNTIHFSGIAKNKEKRRLFILTLNSLNNYPSLVGQRPNFLCPSKVIPI